MKPVLELLWAASHFGPHPVVWFASFCVITIVWHENILLLSTDAMN